MSVIQNRDLHFLHNTHKISFFPIQYSRNPPNRKCLRGLFVRFGGVSGLEGFSIFGIRDLYKSCCLFCVFKWQLKYYNCSLQWKSSFFCLSHWRGNRFGGGRSGGILSYFSAVTSKWLQKVTNRFENKSCIGQFPFPVFLKVRIFFMLCNVNSYRNTVLLSQAGKKVALDLSETFFAK